MTKKEQKAKHDRRALIGRRTKALANRSTVNERRSEAQRERWRLQREAAGLDAPDDTDSGGSPDADLQDLPDGVLA